MNLKEQTAGGSGLKTWAITLLMCTCTIVSVLSCKKGDSTSPGNTSRFKAADFKIANIVPETLSYGLSVDYEESNTTSMNYDYDNDGSFHIKWMVKTTDGIQYQEDRLLATELDAGAAASLSCVIEVTPGKTIDVSTLKYEVYFDH